tara:strand:- start:379 stop:576 length:198 start_codon:yes stop_codon:yes gene_type:complete
LKFLFGYLYCLSLQHISDDFFLTLQYIYLYIAKELDVEQYMPKIAEGAVKEDPRIEESQSMCALM